MSRHQKRTICIQLVMELELESGYLTTLYSCDDCQRHVMWEISYLYSYLPCCLILLLRETRIVIGTVHCVSVGCQVKLEIAVDTTPSPVLCQMPFLSQRSQFTWVWDWCRVLLYTHPVTYWNPCGLSVLSVNFCCCRVECCPVIYDSVNKTSSPLN